MASTTRKPRQSAAAKAALDANAPAVVAEKMKTPAEVQADLVATVEAPVVTEAPALTERKRRVAEAKAKRDAAKAAVEARAAEVKAEQDANPTPPKAKQTNEAAEAKRKAQAERVTKVIELRKAGKKLGEIASELGYTSQQVVSSVLRRHAPELQVRREATGGLTLTPEQVTELRELETRYGAKLATITRALGRS